MKAIPSSIDSEVFGTMPDGTEVLAYTLINDAGMRLKIITYGATIAECWVPDRNASLANVVLGFDNLERYLAKHPRFGATIGRYANRIANARFELDGQLYKLTATHGTSCAHGGVKGFDKKVWTVIETVEHEHKISLKLAYRSVDMEEGFPGNLDVQLTFSLYKQQNSFSIEYGAETDKPTPINLTNHSYFNLKGSGNGNILDHIVGLNATRYTPLNDDLVPTGEIAPAVGTGYDFHTARHRIGERIEQVGGYDINYLIDMRPGDIEGVGSVEDPDTGRTLTVFTNQPCFQFFTANSLDGTIYGIGGSYPKHAGFCLETQGFPNAVNEPNFPNPILTPGARYGQFTQFFFGTRPQDN